MNAPAARSVRVPAVPAAVVALSAAGLLLAGCGSSATESERGSETLGAASRVEVTTDSGDITVRQGPGGASTVDRELRWGGDRPEVVSQVQGDVLRVTATCPDDDECSTDLVITVPAAAAVRAETSAGDVTVTGLSGAHDLTTSAGDVRGTGLGAGPATVRTSAGAVDLAFAAAPPTVDAESSAGDVVLRLPSASAYEVDATSAAGAARVEVVDTPGADSRIRARSAAGTVAVVPG